MIPRSQGVAFAAGAEADAAEAVTTGVFPSSAGSEDMGNILYGNAVVI